MNGEHAPAAPLLFQPLAIAGVVLRNRIAVSPMCQYSALDGVVTDWHRAHYAGLARGGAALVIVEATAVSPEGRITLGCTGLWNDAQRDAFVPIVRGIEEAGAVAGIQLNHAGARGSSQRPWEGGRVLAPDDPGRWPTVSASAFPRDDGEARALDAAGIRTVVADFVAASARARDAGFRWIELHFAHGYLASQFLSPYANSRDDDYGGSFEGRSRLLLEIVEAVRGVWPADRPLTVRLGAVEFDGEDEVALAESIELARRFAALGVDLVDVSMRGLAPHSCVPFEAPAFLAPVAGAIRDAAGVPVMASFRLGDPVVAEGALAAGQVDVVAIGSGMLRNPHWPFLAARELGAPDPGEALPVQYSFWLARRPA